MLSDAHIENENGKRGKENVEEKKTLEITIARNDDNGNDDVVD